MTLLQSKWITCFSLMMIMSGPIIPSSVFAAAAGNTHLDQQQINQRDRQQQEERKERNQSPDVFLQPNTPLKEPFQLPSETPSFFIKSIVVRGESYSEFQWITEKTLRYQGQKIGRQGINQIVKTLTNELIQRGYVTTRILIPEQDLSSGVLELMLVPGKIHAIRLEGAVRSLNWRTAFPARPGDLLNLRDLEQGLEQIKRVPSQDATLQLVPAEKSGETDVVVKVKQEKPEKLILSIDDSGNKATGKWQFSTTFSIDNLLGINDLFHAGLSTDVGRRPKSYGTNSGSLYYSFPYGNWTYSFSENRNYYYQSVPTINGLSVYSGRSDTFSVDAKKLLTRNQTSKTYFEAGLIVERKQSYIDDTELDVQREKATAVELALSQRQYVGQGVWDWRLSHKQGVPWMHAQVENKELEGQMPTTRFHIWNLDLSFNTPIKVWGSDARYSTTFHGQYTNSLLYSTEEISIGNRYTVRGFDGEQTLLAERGWYWQNELSFPLGQSGQEIYTGVDWGRVSGPSSSILLGKELVGAVVGLRGGSKSLHYDVFVGCPLKRPRGYKTENPTYGFQLVQEI